MQWVQKFLVNTTALWLERVVHTQGRGESSTLDFNNLPPTLHFFLFFSFFWGEREDEAGPAFDAFKFKFSQPFTIKVMHAPIPQNKDGESSNAIIVLPQEANLIRIPLLCRPCYHS